MAEFKSKNKGTVFVEIKVVKNGQKFIQQKYAGNG